MLAQAGDFLFGGWAVLGRTLVVGVLAYVALVVVLQVSGKRTLSKMNAFDLVVTVALGSTLATILLSQDVALAEGLLALVLLVVLQLVVTWSSVRWPLVSRLVKADPALLLYDGRFLDEALRRERVTRAEVLATIRSANIASVAAVKAVVLETDGSISVVPHPIDPADPSAISSLSGVKVPGKPPRPPEAATEGILEQT